MDWEAVYSWFEQHSGVSYDLNDDISQIKGDVAFTETFTWATKISLILDELDEALDVIDENHRELTEDLPGRDDFKRMLVTDTIMKILNEVNGIKRQLGITPTKIKTVNELLQHVNALRDLINMLKINPIEDIIKDKLFEKYEDENDDAFSELLDLHKNDMTNLWETVRSVVDYIEDDDDESDWDDFERSLVEEDVENDNEE